MRKAFIAILLCATFILHYFVPITSAQAIEEAETISQESEEVSSEENGIAPNEETEVKKAEALGEICALRTENTKQYQLSNGSVSAVVYAYPVHYMSKDGFKEIDDSLHEQTMENDQVSYINGENSYSVIFTEGTELMTLTENEYRISFSPVYVSQDKNTSFSICPIEFACEGVENVKSNDTEIDDGESVNSYHPAISTITYSAISEGMHLTYTPMNYGIKESIILEHPECSVNLSFVMCLDALTAKLDAENNVILLYGNDGEEWKYNLTAPFMEDANGSISHDIQYELLETEIAGEYIVRLIPDEEWLDKAAYPVVIDPTICRNWNNGIIQRVSVSQNGRDSGLYVGRRFADSVLWRAYMQFDLPELEFDNGAVICKAMLHTPGTYEGVGFDRRVFAYCISTAWSASSITWSTQPLTDTVLNNSTLIDSGGANGAFIITKTVRDWYEGNCNNYGIGLVSADEDHKNFTSISYYSNDTYLEINYRVFNGTEDYWSAHSISAHGAGNGYINDYSGSWTFVHSDVETTGTRMPMTIQHIYNSVDATKNENACGMGWRLNYQQTIEAPPEGVSITDYPYVYTDSDGTRHYFRHESVSYNQNGDGLGGPLDGLYVTAVDEDGLGLYIVPVRDPSLQETYPLKMVNRSAGFSFYFDKAGRLAMITDSNQAESGINSSEKEQNRILISYVNSGETAPSTAAFSSLYTDIQHLHSNFQTLYPTVLSELRALRENDLFANQYILMARINYIEGLVKSAYNCYLAGYSDPSAYTDMDRMLLSAKQAAQSLLQDAQDIAPLLVQRIGSITDAVGNTAQFSYNEDGNLASISDPAHPGQLTSFSYINKKQINTITDWKNDESRFMYLSNGNMRVLQSPDAYQLYIAFDAQNRVNSVFEARDSAHGQEMWITYRNDDTTDFRFSGEDDIIGTNDDVVNTYAFDKMGRAVSVYSRLNGSVKLLGASSYAYISSDTGDNNKLTDAAVTEGIVTNYLLGHTAPNTTNGWTSYSASSATGLSQTLTLPAGQYTLSGYIKIIGGGGTGRIYAQNGSTSYSSEVLSSVTNTTINKGWKRVSVSFTLQEQGPITVCLEKSNGNVSFQHIQLEKGTVAGPYNYFENGGFERNPTGAAINNNVQGLCSLEPFDGEYNYHLVNTHGSSSVTLDTGVKETGVFLISGWVKPELTPTKGISRLKVSVRQTNYDNRTNPPTSSTRYAERDFTCDTNGWVYFAIPFQSYNMSDYGIWYSSENADLIIEANGIGNLYIDGLQMVKDDSYTGRYSSTGALTSSGSLRQTTTYGYDAYDRMTSSVSPSGIENTYTYNTVTNELTQSEINYCRHNYTYDRYGNLTAEKAGLVNYIYSANTYTSNGNYLAASSDSRGKTTTYTHNTTNGLLTSAKNAKNIVTTYGYNARELPASTTIGSASVSFAYDSADWLSTITRNGFSYAFTYDVFGNRTSLAAAGTTLASYTYADYNGKMTGTSYGNGYSETYDYDEHERLVSVLRNGTAANVYAYDALGNLARYEDHAAGLRFDRDYTANGLVKTEEVRSLSNGTLKYELAYTYDDLDRPLNESFLSDSTARTVSYTYADHDTQHYNDLPLTQTFPGGATFAYQYDNLNRPTQQVYAPTASAADAKKLYTLYTYLPGATAPGASGAGTTELVQTYTNRIGTAESGVVSRETYTYDNVGHIATVTDANGNTTAYTYNKWDELTRVNDQAAGKTYTYTYNVGGNITAWKEYPYTTGTLGTATATHTYTYGSTWKDKLTKYDGVTITYDALGNPLYYRGKTLTWQNGRELATVNGTTSYTYGADGIRTAKTVSGVTTTYALSGSTVLSQTTGNETLFFYYDVNGNLAQIGYKNGTAAEVFYFVTHNLQGDVTAIYNAADSTLVGTYSYDPWGRITAVTPSSSTSDPNGILTKNPFRYRGYYYDAETGFYYLNSRYYDPELCRFLNADMLLDGRTLLGYNLFAYCVNDPVNLTDSRGEFAITATVVTVGVLLGGLALIGAVAANDPSVQTAVADIAKDIRNGAKNALAQLCGSTPASPSPGPNRDDDYDKQSKSYSGKSKRLNGEGRIDYEYYGNGRGNIHIHLNGEKYTIWEFDNGTAHFSELPSSISKIVNSAGGKSAVTQFIKAIETLSGY